MKRLFRLGGLLLCSFALFSQSYAQEPDPVRIWISDTLPLDMLLMVNPLFESGGYQWTTDAERADLILDFGNQAEAVSTEWIYAPVVPFAHTAETIRWSDIRAYWQGEITALSYLTPDGIPPTFVASNETYRAMVLLLGQPAEGVPIRIVPLTESIIDDMWEIRPYGWGIVGFNDLTPRHKVLTMDRVNLFGDNFATNNYPLKTQLTLSGDVELVGQALEDLLTVGTWESSNRQPEKLGRVVLTGVTALSRATAYQMERYGLTRPAEGVNPFFEDAHLLHTSNEVAFTENCEDPDPYGGVIFCSKESYFELLLEIGLDVVELTGNHINDYGPGAFRNSLDLYAENGIATFGGGYDPQDARDAYITEVNGTSIAFIGCNVPGPLGAFASETREGAAPCDEEYLATELNRLSVEVDIVIMTVQEFEYYRYTVGEEQLERFERYAAWGADVVIGSQAHQPQGFTFSPTGAFLHHGLGNLFFDQMAEIGTRQLFADKLITYDGQLISVVLFTGIIEDFCCPRPMTTTERIDFLDTIFQASGW